MLSKKIKQNIIEKLNIKRKLRQRHKKSDSNLQIFKFGFHVLVFGSQTKLRTAQQYEDFRFTPSECKFVILHPIHKLGFILVIKDID